MDYYPPGQDTFHSFICILNLPNFTMSTYILMKVLESAPSRYDKGIKLLTLGSLDPAYDTLADQLNPGDNVLDIGCGTGALSLRAAAKGAVVTGIDINPEMLEIAAKRAAESDWQNRLTFKELGVAELSNEPEDQYDAIISGLCFSELTFDEVDYTLRQAYRLLKPNGRLLIADEIRPGNSVKRILNGLFRIPLVIITWLITQTTTSAVLHLPERTRAAGFIIDSSETNRMETFLSLRAHKPEVSTS